MNLTPYKTIENKDYDLAEIKITNELFSGVDFIGNKSVISFENCNFKKLKLINESEIDFKDISIHFSFCHIQDIETELIVSKQISLHFFSCIIQGNIKNSLIKSVSINNCITPSLFLQNQNQAHSWEANLLLKI